MNLVPTNDPAPPGPPSAGIARAVSYLSNKLIPAGGGHELPASEALTPVQRQGLERRLERLDGWLAPFNPADEQRVRDELAALLATRKGSAPVGDARVIVAIYLADLRDLPFHAIQAACLDYRHGRVARDEGFRPIQGDIRRQAQRHLHDLAREQGRIRAILGATLVDRRPDAATRKASAEAARAAFRIPSGGLVTSDHPHEPAGQGSIGETARDLFLRSSLDAWKRGQAEKSGAVCPEGRFDDGEAA